MEDDVAFREVTKDYMKEPAEWSILENALHAMRVQFLEFRRKHEALEKSYAELKKSLAYERQLESELNARLVAIRDQANSLTGGFGCSSTEDAFGMLVERYKSCQSMLEKARNELEEVKKSKQVNTEEDDRERKFTWECLALIDELLRGHEMTGEEGNDGRIGWVKAAQRALRQERAELAKTEEAKREFEEMFHQHGALKSKARALVHAIISKHPDRTPSYFPASDYVGWLTRSLEEALSVYKSQRVEFEASKDRVLTSAELTSLKAENRALKEEVLKVERQLAEDFEAYAEERAAWLDLETTALLLADYAAPEPREEPTYRPTLERIRWGTSRLRRAMRTLQRHIDLIPEVRGKFERMERELSVLKDQVVGNSK